MSLITQAGTFETPSESLADKLKAHRRVHGLSQKKLAEQLGIDHTTLAGWEKETHRPSKKLLDKTKFALPYFPFK